MPRVIQTVAGFYTAVGAGTDVATPANGDSFNVSDFKNGSAWLEQLNASGNAVDWVRVRSPRLHDANQGLRMWVGANPRRPLLPWGSNQQMFAGDQPTVEIDFTGAGSGGILATYSYDDLNNNAARLANWADISGRIDQIAGFEVDLAGAAIGQWSAGVTPVTFQNNAKARRDYAWLGYTLSVQCLGIRLTGADTGNFGIGGPGDADALQTSQYFQNAAMSSGRPFIPIISADNMLGTILQNVDIAANTATKVTMILALLKP